MNCQECRDLTDAYLDRELDGPTAGAFERHVRACEPCAARVTRTRGLHRQLSEALNQGTRTPSVWDRIEAAIVAPAVPRAVQAGQSRATWRQWFWPSPAWHTGLAAVWVVIALAQPTIEGTSQDRSFSAVATTSPAFSATWMGQRREVARLLEPATDEDQS